MVRIIEDDYEGHELYSNDLKERVRKTYELALMISNIKMQIINIKNEAETFKKLFMTKEELQEGENVVQFFNARMQATVYYTLKNIENYKMKGWTHFIDEGD